MSIYDENLWWVFMVSITWSAILWTGLRGPWSFYECPVSLLDMIFQCKLFNLSPSLSVPGTSSCLQYLAVFARCGGSSSPSFLSLSHWPCCCQRKWGERNVNTSLKLKIFISPEETRVRFGVISFVLILSSKHWTTNLMCRTSSLIASISNKTKTQTQTIAEEIFTQTVQFALHGTVRWLIVPQILLQFTAWIMFCSYLQRSKIQIGLRPQPASTVTIIVTIPRL